LKGAARALRQPPAVWLLGIGGLFGYHARYFAAVRLAPAAEATLINYLWPLLIVLFSSLILHERLRSHHIVGALLGLCGTVLVVAGGPIAFAPDYLPGYAAAFCASIAWALYSVLSRRFAQVPTDAVAGFCLCSAALAALCHLGFETTVWPQDATQWLAVLGLGLGPTGAAFYVWDFGVKHGDIRVLGAVSYAAPILSTLFLVLAGHAEPTLPLALATMLIAGGGLIAAKDMLFSRSSAPLPASERSDPKLS
ncbi:MAG: DMT family transporter, partial [Pseudorhodoplanes sp.]